MREVLHGCAPSNCPLCIYTPFPTHTSFPCNHLRLRWPTICICSVAFSGYEQPTPIQCQALPAALSGRDVLGLAKTGSGKTAAFVLPMIVHIMDQPELEKGEGPIGVIVAPTRELAEQIHRETRRAALVYGFACGFVRICVAIGTVLP